MIREAWWIDSVCLFAVVIRDEWTRDGGKG